MPNLVASWTLCRMPFKACHNTTWSNHIQRSHGTRTQWWNLGEILFDLKHFNPPIRIPHKISYLRNLDSPSCNEVLDKLLYSNVFNTLEKPGRDPLFKWLPYSARTWSDSLVKRFWYAEETLMRFSRQEILICQENLGGILYWKQESCSSPKTLDRFSIEMRILILCQIENLNFPFLSRINLHCQKPMYDQRKSAKTHEWSQIYAFSCFRLCRFPG
jgi:hypothetical protein